jgi:hypothetical protein
VTAVPPPGQQTRVRATVWGIDAYREQVGLLDLIGREWPGADRFDVRAMSLIDGGGPCRLDAGHLSVYASNSGPGWAWILYDPSTPVPLLPPGRDDGAR